MIDDHEHAAAGYEIYTECARPHSHTLISSNVLFEIITPSTPQMRNICGHHEESDEYESG